jgi:hypothetical protein
MKIGKAKIAAALMTAALYPALIGALTIEQSYQPQKLTVGDKFVFKNEVPAGMGLEPLPLPETFGDATALSQIFKLRKSSKGKEAFACTLAVYKPGEVKIPSFSFRVANSADTAVYTGDTLKIDIMSVLPADTAGLKIAEIREPKRLRGPIWPYIVAPIVIVLLVIGIKLLRDKLRKKALEPAVPPMPAWELAFKRLDELKAERHPEFGRFKQFYFELSLIIRGYIEERYETRAVESTTYELENDDKLATLPDDMLARLFELFHRADLAKFAKSIPTINDAESDMSFAYDFVVKTKPLPLLLEKQESALEVGA